MVWVTVVLPVVAVVGLAVAYGSRSMNIPRDPTREGAQDREASRAYDRVSHWPVFAVERRMILWKMALLNPYGTVVDIGCGPGFLTAGITRRFPLARVIGLDNNRAMIDIASRNWPAGKYGIEFVTGDAHLLPFADNTVDFAVSSLSMHHWTDAGTVFREIYRVLKPGGRFLVFDLRRNGPRLFYWTLWLSQVLLAPQAIRRTNGSVGSFWASYTPSELRDILSENGMKYSRVQPGIGWVSALGGKAGTD